MKKFLENRYSLKLILSLLFLLEFILLYSHSVNRQISLGIDYPIFYKAALNHGQAEGYVYPPLLAWALNPLAKMSLENSVRLWYVIQALITLGALWVCLPKITVDDRARTVVAIIYTLAVARLVALNAEIGQVNGLVLLLILGGIISNRPSTGGLLLGLATALKLSPALILPYGLIRFKESWEIFVSSFVSAVIIGWILPWLSGYDFSGIANLTRLVGSASANLGLYELIGDSSYILLGVFLVFSLVVSSRTADRWEILLIPVILMMLFVPFVRKAHLIIGAPLALLIPTSPRRASFFPLLWAIGSIGTIVWIPSASIGNLAAFSFLLHDLLQRGSLEKNLRLQRTKV